MAEASLASLPTELLILVLQNVAAKDVLALGCLNRSFNQVINDDDIWRALAAKKWGSWAPRLAAGVAPGGWRTYCLHRMNLHSLPPSPLDLIQERYPDPWQHLASTILCSRTTGGPTVRQAITTLLDRLPSPSAVLDADKAMLWELLHPLGLQAARFAALKAMSRDFLEKDWEDPSSFKGCGKFCSDSWRIFCRGLRSPRGVEDATLLRYLRWLTKGQLEEKKGGRQQGAGRGARQEASASGAGKRKREEGGGGAGVGGEQRALRSRGSALHQRQTPPAADRRVTRSAAARARR